jgi:hypothetical protein
MVNVTAWREEASRQTRLLGTQPITSIRLEQDALSNLAKVLDDTLIPVIDERLRVDVYRPVPREEEFLLPGLDRAR